VPVGGGCGAYHFVVSPQRRIALASVAAACVLIAIKVGVGLESDSLGLLSEAIHSGTDLVAALLTFFAVGVAGRPADRSHPYGHGKAEHLAALAEAAILVALGLFVAGLAVRRLIGPHPEVEAAWWAFAAVGVVIAIDLSRMLASRRAARRYNSAALGANALHFGGDLAGSVAVLTGFIAVRAGAPWADSVAALFVAVLVLTAAGRLMRQNVDVLMDTAPSAAHATARRAIAALQPPVELRRLRLREAGGRHFADVVIGLAPGAAVAQAHSVADAVESAVEAALPGSDVVVHVEPKPAADEALREQALAAALAVPSVREIHNVTVLRVGDRIEVSLHLKLPGELSLDEAHRIATAVEAAIGEALPEVDAVQTHLEPLTEAGVGRAPSPSDVEAPREVVRRAVRETTGADARELRFLQTDAGLVAYLTLPVAADAPLAEAHARAAEVKARIRDTHPEIADVIVHTEPGSS
jgi:cation diffusion facilitator family transporter